MIIHILIYLCLFIIGCFGLLLSRKNIILILMSLEILLLSINMLFSIYSIYLDDLIGIIFIFCILPIAAGETAIGLSLIITYYRTTEYL